MASCCGPGVLWAPALCPGRLDPAVPLSTQRASAKLGGWINVWFVCLLISRIPASFPIPRGLRSKEQAGSWAFVAKPRPSVPRFPQLQGALPAFPSNPGTGGLEKQTKETSTDGKMSCAWTPFIPASTRQQQEGWRGVAGSRPRAGLRRTQGGSHFLLCPQSAWVFTSCLPLAQGGETKGRECRGPGAHLQASLFSLGNQPSCSEHTGLWSTQQWLPGLEPDLQSQSSVSLRGHCSELP